MRHKENKKRKQFQKKKLEKRSIYYNLDDRRKNYLEFK